MKNNKKVKTGSSNIDTQKEQPEKYMRVFAIIRFVC